MSITRPSTALVSTNATTTTMIEARLTWGTTIVTVKHLAVDAGVSVGENGDLFLPLEVLGSDRVELIGKGGALLSDRITVDGRSPMSPSLSLGHAAVAVFGDFAVTMRLVEREHLPVGTLFEGLAVAGLGTVVLSALAHGSLIGAFALFMPAMGSDDSDALNRDQMLRMRTYLDAAAEREKELELKLEDGASESADDPSGGGKAMGEAGLMGKPEASTNGKWAAKKNFDANEVTFNRARALEEARDSVMSNLVGSLASNIAAGPVTPWGSVLNGQDDASYSGNFWGAELGDSAGNGLSNLLGDGPGGGGNNLGFGINDVGGLSKSLADRSGSGTCGSHCGGRLIGRTGHTSHAPVMREMKTEIDGTIPREVIQRIVRQNFGRFRNCYEGGLRTNPSLSGRVQVKFVIDRTGSVSIADDGGSDLADHAVSACVVKSFYGLSFPAPERGSVRVTYPIMLSPGDA